MSRDRHSPSILVLAGSSELAGPVHEQAAAAGVAVQTRPPGAGLAPAGLVLADEDRLAEAVSAAGRRAGPLHVLAPGPVPDAVYRRALDAGAVSVIALPEDLPRLGRLLADLDRPRQGRVVAVTGGSGGVGASVLAAAVALRAVDRTTGDQAAGAPTPSTMLVDLDADGPGLGRLVEGPVGPGVTWSDLVGLEGRLAASELRSSVPTASGVGLLTWSDDRALEAVQAPVVEVVAAAARGHDWVVLDVPRAMADGVGQVTCDLLVVVVQGSVPGVASAVRRLARLRATGHPVAVVVRTGRGSAGAADVARVLDVPLLGELREDRRLRERLDLGLGPVRGRRCPVGRAADAVLDGVPAPQAGPRPAWPR
jgi:secretion/DNA translocation related CpaE-like protein